MTVCLLFVFTGLISAKKLDRGDAAPKDAPSKQILGLKFPENAAATEFPLPQFYSFLSSVPETSLQCLWDVEVFLAAPHDPLTPILLNNQESPS